MFEHHLTTDDMPLFTRLRMTAFGEAVIDIANDPACDEWTFSQKIRHALDKEGAARSERRRASGRRYLLSRSPSHSSPPKTPSSTSTFPSSSATTATMANCRSRLEASTRLGT